MSKNKKIKMLAYKMKWSRVAALQGEYTFLNISTPSTNTKQVMK